jgi:hypothetical protein
MERIKTLSLATANGADVLEKGRLNLEKGKAMRGIRLKVTVPVVKSDSGTVTLTAGQKLSLLNMLVVSLRYGRNLRRAPYNNVLGGVLQVLQRYLMGTQVQGWADTVYGLGKTIAASATTTVQFYLIIPTGYLQQVNGLPAGHFAVGRSQAKTLQLDIKRAAEPLTGGAATLSVGTVTIDVMPDLVSVKGDRWTVLPEYVDVTSVDIEKGFDDGLPLLLAERTAVHASSTLTEVEVSIDDENIHRQVTPQDLLTEWKSQPSSKLHADADISDVWTLLYWVAWDKELRDLPTGAIKFRQPRKDLATMLLSLLYVPIVREAELREEIENVATDVRKKTVRAVSTFVSEPDATYSRQQFASPFVLFDEDDSEFQRFPGLVAVPGGRAEVYIPATVLSMARGMVAGARSEREGKKADQLVQQATLAVPGAVQSGRGFSHVGSTVFEQVKKALG